MPGRYISPADTAKLIRKALKREFPGQKFYVQTDTYSGGASVNVKWMDGPTEAEVKAQVTNNFEGKGFDGMIDMSYYIDHWLLPDGTVQVALDQGSQGSRGLHPRKEYPKPHPKAERVRFGANYIFATRVVSVERAREFAQAMSEELGWDAPEIVEQSWFAGRGKPKGKHAYFQYDYTRDRELQFYDRKLRKTSFYKSTSQQGE